MMHPARTTAEILTGKYVERYDRRTEALAREVDLIGQGYTATIEWETGKRRWRLVYWRALVEEEAADGDR